jgi:uncharacterized protein with von Willebrand factor type A (vWA) domain
VATPTPAAPPDPVELLTTFARTLRGRGVTAGTSRLTGAVEALAHLDPCDVDDVYWAGRLTLCAGPDDLARYDEAFGEWILGAVPTPAGPGDGSPVAARVSAAAGAGAAEDAGDTVGGSASGVEVLRHRDVTDLDAADRDELEHLVALLAPHVPLRRTRRRTPGRGHEIDRARTVRAMIADGGEPRELVRRRRRTRPRRVVLLIDVSGSMKIYADLFLRFAHAAVRVAPSSTEVFTVGTRLTRVTRQLRSHDPQEALAAAGATVPDWSGGTLLGESLQAFLDLWGHRGTARGATVVIASDGWERGGAVLLGEQMARLRRLAHRVLWVNPHSGRDGFAPTTAGMTAALPHVDALLAGHTYAAFEELATVIARA